MDNLAELETTVGALLARRPSPTPTVIRECISLLRGIYAVDDDTAEALARDFEARHSVSMTIGAMLTEREHRPWLANAQAGIDPYY